MKNSGLTMIEIMFYLAISAIIFLASFFVVNFINQVKVKNQAVAEVEYQGNIIMDKMLQSVRTSQGVNTPIVGASDTSLSISMSDSSKNPTVYSFSGNNITIKEGASSTTNLGNSNIAFSSGTFTNDSASADYDSIKVSFTITYVNPSGKSEYNYSRTFYGTASTRKK
ncbi:MAG: hypothetical protein PHW52_01225 [Candidatus Pacebacteria bacterium]|nr:hypothetical protein [Candidatus Paceibacterota bacterium]